MILQKVKERLEAYVRTKTITEYLAGDVEDLLKECDHFYVERYEKR